MISARPPIRKISDSCSESGVRYFSYDNALARSVRKEIVLDVAATETPNVSYLLAAMVRV